jgi:hypothetical protein
MKAYAGQDKIFVFVDDLDRCDASKVADLMHAMNLLLTDGPSLMLVVGMDRARVAAGIAAKQKQLLEYVLSAPSDNSAAPAKGAHPRLGISFGYAFVEKFIQVPFVIPKPTSAGIGRLCESLASEKSPRASLRMRGMWQRFRRLRPRIWSRGNRMAGHGDKSELGRDGQVVKLNSNTGHDSDRIRAIVSMVAPSLQNNPRRIKQFLSLFRITTYIASSTGLFSEQQGASGPEGVEDIVTLEKLGKFVAITLGWPLLRADMDFDRDLLSDLQSVACNEKPITPSSSRALVWWASDANLMELLRVGCSEATDGN